MTDDERRISETKTMFRAVNDEIEGMVEALCLELPEFLCECGGETCSERVCLTASEYEAVRAEPSRFVVAPGHELAGENRLVSSNGRYSVVETRAREAAAERPRTLAGRLTLCL